MLEKIAEKEKRIKAAYREGIDTLEEYKANKQILLKEKEKLQEMRENCQHFDKSQSIPNLLALIEDLVEEKP